MASQPSFWRKTWFQSWFKSIRPTRAQKKHWRAPASRRLRLECLEGRALLTTLSAVSLPAAIPANATSLTITATTGNFSPLIANDGVTLTNTYSGSDSPACSVVSASPTSLTVALTAGDLSLLAGTLTAAVTVTGGGGNATSSAAPVTPVVTSSIATRAVNAAATLKIYGYGFDTAGTLTAKSLTDGESGTWALIGAGEIDVTAVTSTPATSVAGPLNASFSLNGQPSGDGVDPAGPVQVATLTPVVTSSAAAQVANLTSFSIAGFGFAPSDTVTFNDGAVGTVDNTTTATSLVVDFNKPGDVFPTTAGTLNAVVTATGGASSVTPLGVATILPVLTSVTSPANPQAVNQTSMSFTGFGFDPNLSNDSIVFTDGAATPVGTVTGFAAGATGTAAETITVTFTTLTSLSGALDAVVDVGGVYSGNATGVSPGTAVQVATLTPSVTISTVGVAGGGTAQAINIAGYGFSSTAANDAVTLKEADGTTVPGGNITVSNASSTLLQLTLDPGATVVGPLTASVSLGGGITSGTAVQVATVLPTISSNLGQLTADPSTTKVYIVGTGFSTTVGNDSVTFDDGAVGTIADRAHSHAIDRPVQPAWRLPSDHRRRAARRG